MKTRNKALIRAGLLLVLVGIVVGPASAANQYVYFSTTGLPAGNEVDVQWHYYTSSLSSGWRNFTSPGPGSSVATNSLAINFYYAYPPVISAGGNLYYFKGADKQSPVFIPGDLFVEHNIFVSAEYGLSCTAPSIGTQPASATTCAGVPVTFFVTTTGTTPSYQWRHGGTNITGAVLQSYTIPSPGPADAGSYDVLVWNSCGSQTSAAATLVVNTAPEITGQPAGMVTCEGSSASFGVTATGTAPLFYQWRHDGTNITGAEGTGYLIPSVVLADAGSYDVLVWNSCGTVTSDAAVLTVNSRPVVTEQPENVTVCAGGRASFSVEASGTEPFSYQWRHDGTNVTGATRSHYRIDSVATGDAGAYSVLVTNGCGTTSSDSAYLVVNVPPSITVQPADVTADVFTPASFSVTADGTGPLSYQWRHDGTNITGAVGTEYQIASVHGSDGGQYDVTVWNGCDTIVSDPATLTVDRAPTTTTLTSSWNPSVFYLPAEFTSYVGAAAGIPTGTVRFLDGKNYLGEGTLNESGWANFTATSSFTVGIHTINATYLGDGEYRPSYTTISQTVNQYPPPVITGISPVKGIRGKPVLIKITGTGFLFDSIVNLSHGSNEIYGDIVKVRPPVYTARFTIRPKATVGNYNLTVTNIDGQSDTLVNVFRVKK